MASEREALLQLARILGDEVVLVPLGLSRRHLPAALEEGQRRRLQAVLDGQLPRLAEALLVEAVANDDVVDRASALAYLEDRLRSLGQLLSPQQIEGLRHRLRSLRVPWA
ncbi:MAG TPA: hypothetical protein VNL95_04920 [Dehalococcoidia bacterium]|nr:hypothetical protein [Dehalococcoidia bacterium]